MAVTTRAPAPSGTSRGRRPHLPVLTYHRVLPPQEAAVACPGTLSATTVTFEAQMRLLSRRRRPISASELLRVCRGELPLPPRAAMVTFDDGYGDFARHAWPVLRRLGIPTVMFVATAHSAGDRPWYWWDRLWRSLVETQEPATPAGPLGPLPLGTLPRTTKAYRALRDHLKRGPEEVLVAEVDRIVGCLGEPSSPPPILTWDQVRSLRADGLQVASHTVTHPRLTRVDADRRRRELVDSLGTLRSEVDEVLPLIAYPGGDCDDAVAADTAAAGYEVGLSTRRGVNDVRTIDWLRLERVNVGRRTTPALLGAQLSPRVADLARRLT